MMEKINIREIPYECPVCGNEELELGQNFCQICGEGLEWVDEEDV